MADPDRIELTQAAREHPGAPVLAARGVDAHRPTSPTSRPTRGPLADSIGGQGSLEKIDFGAADVDGHARASRTSATRTSPRRRVIFLDLPDAVYRGYEGDEQLLGAAARRRRGAVRPAAPRDPAPRAADGLLPAGASAITSTTSCAATSALSLLAEGRRWVMPGARASWAGTVFYEDFPYAWWNDFQGRPSARAVWARAAGRRLESRPQYSDISEVDRPQGRRPAPLRAARCRASSRAIRQMLDDVFGYHVARGAGRRRLRLRRTLLGDRSALGHRVARTSARQALRDIDQVEWPIRRS